MGSTALLGLLLAVVCFIGFVGLYLLAGCIQILIYTFAGARWCILKLISRTRNN